MAKKGEKKQPKSASAKTASKKTAASNRVRKSTKSQIKKKNKKIIRNKVPMPGSFKLTWQSFSFIKKYWKPLGGIVLVYSLLNFFLASGFTNHATSIVQDFNSNNFSDAIISYSSIISGGNNQSSTMQSVLLIIESLVIIWALRHLFSGEKIEVKQAYYHSSGPLIPFVIVVFVFILQLLPIIVGSTVLAIALSSIISNAWVEAGFTFLFVALAFWSLYMICSSVFAFYIVTLPNMQPRSALKSAKNLVHFRRWHVVRRILFLPFLIFIVMGIFIVPLILYAKFLVTPTFFILCMFSVLFGHTYLYSLYKGLLND